MNAENSKDLSLQFQGHVHPGRRHSLCLSLSLSPIFFGIRNWAPERYTLWWTKIAIEGGPFIVNLPTIQMLLFQSHVKLPQGIVCCQLPTAAAFKLPRASIEPEMVAIETAPSSQNEPLPATVLLSSDESTRSCIQYLPASLYLYLYHSISTLNIWNSSSGKYMFIDYKYHHDYSDSIPNSVGSGSPNTSQRNSDPTPLALIPAHVRSGTSVKSRPKPPASHVSHQWMHLVRVKYSEKRLLISDGNSMFSNKNKWDPFAPALGAAISSPFQRCTPHVTAKRPRERHRSTWLRRQKWTWTKGHHVDWFIR